ncbi:DUF6082 family protein [Streptomyces sp. CC210A]|uniref:DUF6082 family protein n=1 Tax=Streptomyces sp. CC210A TaxID=2898184 RepID=UPI001F4524FC|nr:DUF6082 family protein [Streptomyces sp. CC210A]
MRIGTTVLLAGAAVVGVGVARLHQEAKHQRERVDIALTRNQLDWLEKVFTDPGVAAKWAPAGMEPGEYMGLMSANHMLCALSLRDRLGLVSKRQLRLYALMIMGNKTARRYWERFGHLRAEEAVGDPRAERLHDTLARAADEAGRAERENQPAAA